MRTRLAATFTVLMIGAASLASAWAGDKAVYDTETWPLRR